MPRPAPVTSATLPSKSPIDPFPCEVQCRCRPARLATPAAIRPPWRIPSAPMAVVPRAPTRRRRWRSSSTSRSSTATSTGPTTRAGPFTDHLYGGPGRGAGAAGGGAHGARGPPSRTRCTATTCAPGEAEHPTIMKVSARPRRPLVLGPPGRGAAARQGDLHHGRRRSMSTRRAATGRACRCGRTCRRPRSSRRWATTASAAATILMDLPRGRSADRHPAPERHARPGGCGRARASRSPTTGCCTRPRSRTSPT